MRCVEPSGSGGGKGGAGKESEARPPDDEHEDGDADDDDEDDDDGECVTRPVLDGPFDNRVTVARFSVGSSIRRWP